MFLTNLDPYINTLIIFGAVIVIIVLVYLIFFMPKTKGKSVVEVERSNDEPDNDEVKENKEIVYKPEQSFEKTDEEILKESALLTEVEIASEKNNFKENTVEAEEFEKEPINLEDLETDFEEQKAFEEETIKKELEEKSESDKEDLKQENNDEEQSEEKDSADEEETKELGKYHVLYRKEDSKWYVKREGSEKTLRVLETQAEAIAWATIKALNQDTAIVIHKRDGKIRKQNY
jgi:type IV secretory pathway VirB10-like protein